LGHEEGVKKCSPIELVQFVPGPIFQGESKSEEGNLKFVLWLNIWLYPGWVLREGQATLPDLNGSTFT